MSNRLLALGLLVFLLPVQIQAGWIFPTNSVWAWRPGATEASAPDPTAWRLAGFPDATFTNAPAPFWYGDVRPGGTQIQGMQNVYSCFFLRQFVSVNDAPAIRRLRLTYYIDDGFILWINGTEVFRENVPGVPTIATLATNQPVDPAPLVVASFDVPPGVFVNGSNLVAVQVFNTSLGSSDLGFDAGLEAIRDETVAPVIASVQPAAGASVTSLTQVTVQFSEPVTGVDADDLLVNSVGATGVSGGDASYTFTFPQPGAGPVLFTWNPPHGIADEAFTPNAFNATGPGATWTFTMVDNVAPVVSALFPPAGATVRALGRTEVTFSEEVIGVQAADLRVNGQPATNVFRAPGGPYQFDFPEPAQGAVTVQWAAGHGITDPSGNPLAGGTWSYTLNSNAPLANLVLTEVMAANVSGLVDETGEVQDWIELRNQGGTAVDLAGWSLSDDPTVPGLWVFPAVTLAPGEHLVVFASGLDRRAPGPGQRFHTNFRLADDGEFLGLYTPDSPRILADGFASGYPEQRGDHSYGRDFLGQWRYFPVPTPGATNGASGITGVVAPVHFSSARGHYTQPLDLAMSCATPGAQIRYTTDGNVPTATSGLAYSGPLRLTNSQFLRAGAFRTNLLPSRITSHSFLFNQTPVIRSLPVLSIQTWSNNMTGPSGIIGMNPATWTPADSTFPFTGSNDYHNPVKTGIAWERPMSAELIQSNDNSGFQIDCGMRVQGSDWTRPRYQSNSKFSYRLYFRGDYGKGRLEYPWFSDSVVQSFDQIVLRAGHNDIVNPFLVDELVRQLSADMGQVAVHGTWVNFFLNGVYKGYYNPCERVEETFLQNWHGGGTSWDIITVGSAVQGGDAVEWNSLRTYANNNNPALPAVYTELARRLDMVNFADYLMVNTYAGTWDWPHNNWRAARERAPGGKFRFYVWDAEGGLGETGGGGRSPATFDSFSTTDNGLLTSGAEIPTLYRRMTNSAEFRLVWADRVQKHFYNQGALTDSNIANRFIQMRSELAGVIPAMDSSILTTWVPQRRAPILGQYNLYGLFASSNAPAFNQHGGAVPPGFALSMTAGGAGGTIYYTTNGHDPRVPFSGAVSNAAIAYTGPFTLNGGLQVKARTLNGGAWSALTEATFSVGTLGLPLRISEIMYNPPGGSLYEFIEFQNISGATLDLGLVRVEDAVEFIFPIGSTLAPGARLVLGSDTDTNAWALRYPGVPVAGWFSGSLANSSERITIRDAAGRVVVTVDYRDNAGWPAAADGFGSSLELNDAFGDPDDPANWRASTEVNGTPGTAGSPAAASTVRLNEFLALNVAAVNHGGTRPDFVELYNAGPAATNLAGWSLSDNGAPGQFVFPPGTTLAAGGYLVVWCDAITNSTPGLHTGFELDPDGDGLFLFDAANNRVDAVTFGRQVADRSVGRVGGAWQLTMVSTNAPNTAAALAPATDVGLNEWMANPPAGLPDWIELFNRHATLPAALQGFHLSGTNGTHRLAALSFLAPQGFLQLFADEAVGPDHLDFKLAATADTLALYDASASLLQTVSYSSMAEGASQGRLPDGTLVTVGFPTTASPEAPNYTANWTGPVVNEVMARNVRAVTNAGRVPDYFELFNPNPFPYSLDGLSISVGAAEPGQWNFPPGANVPASGYLVIWCDAGRPASTNLGDFNTGRSLDGDNGGVFLFNPARQLVNSVLYGPQAPDFSIGLVSSQWRLLAAPSPGAVNGTAATLGLAGVLRFNEWMAQPASGSDWVELHNPTNLPIDLAGLILTDDLSAQGTNLFRIPALSFIGPRGFARWVADADPEQGRDHVPFSLDAAGESLRLYAANGTTILDTVTFGSQALGVSEGRLPDGTGAITRFPGTASPGGPNYTPVPGLRITEILTHTDPPLEDAVEVHNVSSAPLPVGGWFLSNSEDNLRKYRLPDNTVIPPGGFLVVSQSQFNTGPNAFSFSSAHGDPAWLSAADAGGNLTGLRVGASFGAAFNGVAFGRQPTSLGVDYAALTARSLGLSNGPIRVGPVVIHEIHFQPPDGPGADDEFIELHNFAATNVPLSHAVHSTNTWKLAGGVDFTFPAGVSIAAGAHVLVVGFNPADAAALAAFRSRQGVAPSVPVYGPFLGRLDNAGETLELLQPDNPQPVGAPDAGFVPYVVADRVVYGVLPPWPTGAVQGGGASLQRAAPSLYGNEALNWVASAPTPGAANGPGLVPRPVITVQPQSQLVFAGTSPILEVTATGSGPLTYQWRVNGIAIPGATNASLRFEYAVSGDTGEYDAIVSNAGGSALSAAASLRVAVPPEILTAPGNLFLGAGSNGTFTVVARGDQPLAYQWFRNGVSLPGATGSSLALTNVQLPDDGNYDVRVSNDVGIAWSGATLTILIPPVITQEPVAQTVVVGGSVTLSASYTGNPPLFTNEWRRQSTGLQTNVTTRFTDFFTFTATNVPMTNRYRIFIRHRARPTGTFSALVDVVTLADTDGDGLPDDWETQAGLLPNNPGDRNLDLDGDGLSNWEEYVAGTDPADAQDYVRVDLSVLPGQAAVQFHAVSNRTYTVEYTDQLGAPWLRLADFSARSTNRIESFPDPVWTTNRSYRLVTPGRP